MTLRLLPIIAFLLILPLAAHSATPDEAAAARNEIARVQTTFLGEVQSATGLSREEISKFMPGGKLYGREITEFHRLSPSQLEALRKADTKKKDAITKIRAKYGISEETARRQGSRF